MLVDQSVEERRFSRITITDNRDGPYFHVRGRVDRYTVGDVRDEVLVQIALGVAASLRPGALRGVAFYG